MINSGCANAATGPEGRRRALHTVTELAARLRCKPAEILVNSTGVIGRQLSDDKIIAALDSLIGSSSPDGLLAAAQGIMTTDTRMKAASMHVIAGGGGGGFNVAGIAKGSGMIHPDMATLIGVIMTDAAVAAPALDTMLRAAVEGSFHRISVDGDTSTNDSVFLLASGQAGQFPDSQVADAIARLAKDLALQVVRDGEGARRLIRVHVQDARTTADALQIAQTVASSLLVRTAVAGGDPNWGRILAAIGRSGVTVDVDRVSVAVGGMVLFEKGSPTTIAPDRLAVIFKSDEVTIDIRLGLGSAHDEFFTCDLTEDYVHINADYTT